VSELSVLVLGAGSAGARHARTLAAAGARVTVTDPDEDRAAATGLARVPYDLDRLTGYDAIVVASPSVHHAEQAAAALAAAPYVLVEKPLTTGTDGLDELVAAAGDRVMVGYNLRLHEPVERFVDIVESGRAGEVSAIRLWFGSWLPDWRPAVDYRTSYSARRDLGGGVLLDAIHELDLLVWLCGDGDFAVVGALVERIGPLEIDVEDTVKVVLRHASGTAVDLSLDYLSRRYRRGAEVIGDQATVRLDWARQVIEVEDSGGVDRQSIDTPVTRSYERQAERFMAFVSGDSPAPVGAAEGALSVRLAGAIRHAAR
jgi:predicted dehydrogenase